QLEAGDEVDRERGEVGKELVEADRREQPVVLALRIRVEEAEVRVRREVAGAAGDDAERADGRGAGAEEILLATGREPDVAEHGRGQRGRLVQVRLEAHRDVADAGGGAAGGRGGLEQARAVERVRRGNAVGHYDRLAGAAERGVDDREGDADVDPF